MKTGFILAWATCCGIGVLYVLEQTLHRAMATVMLMGVGQ
jgi:hypothetical protein